MTSPGPPPPFRTAKGARLPVFLARRPAEPADPDLAAFYEGLLRETGRDVFRNGEWRLCEKSGWPDNQCCLNLLAWFWIKDEERYLIVVNFSAGSSQARVHLPWDELKGKTWLLHDVLTGATYDRSVDDLRDSGLYVDLESWHCHLFQLRAL
jgi:hypothetical protein